jgi:carbon monoxide dehydrogenase subunit G
MKLENEFRVDVPVEEAWGVLLDVERIAPCMPGAQLQEVEGDEYRGIVKIKVGPITAQYKGAARITEVDDANHRAVLRAEGRDTRGQGNASATVTTTLQPDGGGTRVNIDSDVTITGKVSQFGRGVIADVSAKLLDQFVACLERDVLSTPAEAPPRPRSRRRHCARATRQAAPRARSTLRRRSPSISCGRRGRRC